MLETVSQLIYLGSIRYNKQGSPLMMNRHFLILPLIYLAVLTGCATKPASRDQIENKAEQTAELLAKRGKHKKAANLFQKLAKSKPSQQDQYKLRAAEILIRSGNIQAAQSQSSSIIASSLTVEQRYRLNLLHAQIMLSHGEAERALDKLGIIQPYTLKSADQIVYYQSLAFSHSLMGNLLKSVQARIDLAPLLDREQKVENNGVVLNTLALLPKQTLILKQSSSPTVLAGWMALTTLLKKKTFKQNSIESQTRLEEWKRLYPRHPALSGFLSSYLEGLTHSFELPSSIALLLPESGRYSQAARAIQQGVMAAYEYSSVDYQPSIRFYDSTDDTPAALYQRAVSEGAELIIGPLSKDNIHSLALNAELNIPVLALNHIPGLVKENLFQFALSPIDEAIRISSKARQDGNEKVLLLTPETRQGERIAGYLSKYWEQLGGTVIESQSYNPKKTDFSKPIRTLLNLDESQLRYKKLRNLLTKNIQFTARRRQDVDAIMLSASPGIARSIYPQLRFYRATRIPVYATPQLYTGHPKPMLDRDLNKVVFCDIPWVFPTVYSGDLDKNSLINLSQQFPAKHLRLLAFGIDAFNLIRHLAELDSTSLQGATGKLLLNMENRITRDLVCAKFSKGEPIVFTPFFQEEIDFVYPESYSQ